MDQMSLSLQCLLTLVVAMSSTALLKASHFGCQMPLITKMSKLLGQGRM